jgi:two-component system, NarL family, response regulator DevR
VPSSINTGSIQFLNEKSSIISLPSALLSNILLMKDINPMAKQRILLVDDHEVVRLGLKSLLERHPQFDVVGEASSAREAMEIVNNTHPDVVVMDIRLPGTSGIEACEEITGRFPETKVIMLTSYAEDEMLFSAIRAGASGYILKQIGGEDLVRALEAVGRGEAMLDPTVTQRVFQEVRRAVKEEEASAFAHLSQQEKHVLLLVSEGKTNREIAKLLFLGEGTVRNYVSSILSKLGVSNRAEAAAYAVQHNLREYIA